MDALQSAYRIGARIAWDRFVGGRGATTPEVLYKLAAEIFSYIDRISAESVEGFVSEQSVAEAQRGRRRAAVARLLARESRAKRSCAPSRRRRSWRPPPTVAAW